MPDGTPLVLRSGPRELPPPKNPIDVRPIAGADIRLPNGQRVDIKMAIANLATNGTRELIPAVADKRLFIVGLTLFNGAGAATTVTLKSATTAVSPLISLAANQVVVLPLNPSGYTRPDAVNEAVNATLSNGADVGVIAHYVEVPVDVDWPSVTL